MACRVISCDGALFVLWGKPTPEDMNLVVDRAETMVRASGRPLVYITRVPVDAPPPDAEARKCLDGLMPRMKAACSSYHVVLEGVGFVSSAKRAILAGLMQFGWPRSTFFVHASAREVLFAVPREVRPDVEAILALAEGQGLLNATASADSEPRTAPPGRDPAPGPSPRH